MQKKITRTEYKIKNRSGEDPQKHIFRVNFRF